MRHLQILLIPFSIYFPFSGGCPVIFLNSSLDDCKIISEGEGENTKYYLQKGADTASKKLLGKSTLYIKTGLFHDGGSNVYACTYISEDNKNWVEICKTPTVVHNFGSNVWKWSGTYTYGEN